MKGLKIFGCVVAGMVAIGVAGAASFGLGIFEHKVNNKFNRIVQVDKADTKTEIFKHSEAYIDGAIRDLADYKREFDKAEDEDKTLIANMIETKFADFDIKNLEGNETLYIFLQEIRQGDYR